MVCKGEGMVQGTKQRGMQAGKVRKLEGAVDMCKEGRVRDGKTSSTQSRQRPGSAKIAVGFEGCQRAEGGVSDEREVLTWFRIVSWTACMTNLTGEKGKGEHLVSICSSASLQRSTARWLTLLRVGGGRLVRVHPVERKGRVSSTRRGLARLGTHLFRVLLSEVNLRARKSSASLIESPWLQRKTSQSRRHSAVR